MSKLGVGAAEGGDQKSWRVLLALRERRQDLSRLDTRAGDEREVSALCGAAAERGTS